MVWLVEPTRYLGPAIPTPTPPLAGPVPKPHIPPHGKGNNYRKNIFRSKRVVGRVCRKDQNGQSDEKHGQARKFHQVLDWVFFGFGRWVEAIQITRSFQNCIHDCYFGAEFATTIYSLLFISEPDLIFTTELRQK